MGVLLGICGQAGAGKDTVADHLVLNHKFAKISMADPLKRICKQVFDFSDQQLWGPSQFRNEPDPRWPQPCRNCFGTGVVEVGLPSIGNTYDTEQCGTCRGIPQFLTPRFALQQLGTEWGRNCSPDVWARYAIQQAIDLMSSVTLDYDQKRGLHENKSGSSDYVGVVIPDVRFQNEVDAITKAGGLVWKIQREGAGLSGAAGGHASEQLQNAIPLECFQAVLNNNASLEVLFSSVDLILNLK